MPRRVRGFHSARRSGADGREAAHSSVGGPGLNANPSQSWTVFERTRWRRPDRPRLEWRQNNRCQLSSGWTLSIAGQLREPTDAELRPRMRLPISSAAERGGQLQTAARRRYPRVQVLMHGAGPSSPFKALDAGKNLLLPNEDTVSQAIDR